MELILNELFCYSPVLPFEFCNDVENYNARGRNYTYRTNWEIPELVKLLTAALKTFMVMFARSFINTKRIHFFKKSCKLLRTIWGKEMAALNWGAVTPNSAFYCISMYLLFNIFGAMRLRKLNKIRY